MASQTKKIAFDTAALLSGKAIGLILGIVRLNYLTTYLGVEGFGILNFALYFSSLFQVLFDIGVAQITIREIAQRPSQSRELVGTVLILKILISVFATIVICGAAVAFRFDEVTMMAVGFTTVSLAFTGISAVFLAAFQAHRQMGLVSASAVANDLLLSVAVIALIGQFPFVSTVLELTVVVSIANLVVLLVLYTIKQGAPILRVDAALWKALLHESAPIAVSSVGISFYTFAGPTILRSVRGNDEVGIYSAGYKIISVLTLLPAALSQVVYPIFADFFVTAREKLQKALTDSLRIMLQLSMPTAVVLTVLAPEIISAIYPETFSGAAPVLRLMVTGNALGFLAWILTAFLLATNRQRYCMWTSLGVAAASTLANLFLVPKFGYLGVATIGMATDIVLFFSLSLFSSAAGYSALRGIRFVRVFTASAALAAVMVGLKPFSVPLALVAGATSYVGILAVSGAMGEQEKELLRKLFQK